MLERELWEILALWDSSGRSWENTDIRTSHRESQERNSKVQTASVDNENVWRFSDLRNGHTFQRDWLQPHCESSGI